MPDKVRIALDAMGGDHGAIGRSAGRRYRAHPASRQSSSSCSATAPWSAPCSTGCPASRPNRNWCTPKCRSAWTTSRARRCAMAAGKSSMWLAIDAVKKGEADVAVSAGNTGALMAMARFNLKMIEGIERPALAGTLADAQGRVGRARCRRLDRRRRAASDQSRRHGQRHGARAVRHRAADRRPAQYRGRGGQGPRAGARGRTPAARGPFPVFRLSPASSRATTSARARSMWW